MESTTKTSAAGVSQAGISGKSILKISLLVIFTAVLSHGTFPENSYITGASLIAYMLSKSTINVYLIVPAVAGLLPYISKGIPPWGYIAAMTVCALVFAAVRNIRFQLWQRGLIAASLYITCIGLYSMMTSQVYKISPESLLTEGALIFALIYIFDAFYSVLQSAGIFMESTTSTMQSAAYTQSEAFSAQSPAGCRRELTLASFAVISLMFINSLEFTFAVWMCVVFLTLWALLCLDIGDTLFIIITAGITAAIMGQAQWGVMVSIMAGVFAAAYVRKYGMAATLAVFIIITWLCGAVESGVVLGIDKYCLLLPSAAFFALNWKFGAGMKRIIYRFAGKKETDDESFGKYTEIILKDRSSQMNDLTELYSTYLDSRSVLANQFDMTRQIIDDVRWQISLQGRKSASRASCRFDVDIAISQCAATGEINGDCCGWQDIGGGKVAMVISDGMGKGKKAASESLMVTKTMIALLRSGVTTDVALKMINTIMLMKDNEDSYATLDMVTVDKHSGKARFYKIGAAPTLIRRKTNVEEVKLAEVPLGIVNGLKIRYVETTLKKDDWIIMMSDGVSDGGKGSFIQQVKETVAKVRSADPQTMSDLIINRAADSYIGKERDDLTVMVAHIV